VLAEFGVELVDDAALKLDYIGPELTDELEYSRDASRGLRRAYEAGENILVDAVVADGSRRGIATTNVAVIKLQKARVYPGSRAGSSIVEREESDAVHSHGASDRRASPSFVMRMARERAAAV